MSHRMMVILLAIGLAFLTACQQAEPQIVVETVVVQETVEVVQEVEVTREVEVVVTEEVVVVATPEPYRETPFEELWATSGHADASSEAFVHWDADDPAEVPTSCAKCHSAPGYLDFLGADGTEAGVVDNPAEIGTSVTCVVCHNEATAEKTSVVFPSGMEVMGLGDEARCMECHQGRASTVSVNESIAEAGVADDDTTSEDLGFTNIHYYAAAATQAGNTAMGGYQYDGKSYDSKFTHVEEFDTCIACHDPHTLEVKVEECTACHTNVESTEDMVDIRSAGSMVDYDGDGDMEEGIYYEIEDMRLVLYEAMQAYAADVAGTPIVYDSHSYPYFFIDSNASGEADEDEANYGNRFNAWTGRLAKAAYNYQTSLKDTGGYAHGGKYIIQLMYDSIEDLNSALDNQVDMENLRRIDHGHFAGSEDAFRHWDEDGEVSARCSTCHTAAGLPFQLEHGVQIAQEPSNGFDCATCHVSVSGDEAPIYEIEEVEFPSGFVLNVEQADPSTMVCANCHQGRESSVSVSNLIEGLALDAVSDQLRFLNVHYFASAATRYGADAQGAYQFPGQEYNGFFEHTGTLNSCNDCHNTHALEVEVETCAGCHDGVEAQSDLASIRIPRGDGIDFDGDGDIEEGIAGEIATMEAMLYRTLQAYALETIGTGVLYDSHSYPYFFVDSNGNGEADEGEVTRDNSFNSWTPRLLQGAYNYQYVAKDPGGYAHNPEYLIQVLYDSLDSLGADMTGMVRPEVAVSE